MNSTIIYTTDGKLNPQIRDFCFEHLKTNAPKEISIVKVENDEGEERSHAALYGNILAGIDAAKTKFVFLVEHDVLYPEGYFDVKDSPKLSYSKDVIYLSEKGFSKRRLSSGPLSTFAGDKTILKEAIQAKLAKGEKLKFAEPGIDDEFAELVTFRNVKGCIIDIRHGGNFTGDRKAKKYLDKVPYWGSFDALRFKYIDSDKENQKAKDAAEIMESEKISAKIAAQGQALAGKSLAPLSDFVSVVITSRCEDLLPWTIENVNRTAPGCEIIVVYDGWQQTKDLGPGVKTFFPWPIPIGVGPCRDYGIEHASREYVVLLDAHMDFEDNWLELLLKPVQENDEAITCSKSAVLRPEMLEMENAEKMNTGARMEFINIKGMPFEPKWTWSNAGEVQIILGACYGMNRSHYMCDLLRPWRNAFGWGSSEQLISVVNWFLGGKNILTDAVSGHVYRNRSAVMPYAQTNGTLTGMFYNRCRVIDLLPISDEKKKGLIEAVLNRKDATKYHTAVRNLFLNRDDDLLKEAIEIRGLSWKDYESRFYPDGVQFPKQVEKRKINKTSTQPPTRKGQAQFGNEDFRNKKPAGDPRFI